MNPRSVLVSFNRNVLPGLAVTIVMLIALVVGGELWLRSRYPFAVSYWPSQFDRRFGFNFVPGEVVLMTNSVDFWTTTPVNTLGFLDREPPPSKRDDVCRVLFIGDSQVEAAQVPIEQKFHVVFEGLWNQQAAAALQIETIALGYSGMGQVNELRFYDVFGEPLRPDVLVLVFTSNDFGNNSTVLESVLHGWHPRHPPRLFFEPDPGGSYRSIEPDPEWRDHLLPPAPGEIPNPVPGVSRLSAHSFLYNWINAAILPGSPRFHNWINGVIPVDDIYVHRMREIEKLAGYAGVFGDWNPRETKVDSVFETEDLPPVFEEAVAMTGYALDEYQQRADRDGASLLVFSATSLSVRSPERMNFHRLAELAAERGIPLADQYDYAASRGVDLSSISFEHDGHWNASGHRLAAETLLEFFRAHPALCN
jgi:hypothetical protein